MPELVVLQVERTLMIARDRIVAGEEKREPMPSFALFWSVETVMNVCMVVKMQQDG